MISDDRKRPIAQVDSDDELEQELRRRYEHTMGGLPKWAEGVTDNETSDDPEDEDLADELDDEGRPILQADKLDYKAFPFPNRCHQKKVHSVVFNRNARMLLTSGGDETFALWEIGSQMLSNVHTQKTEDFVPLCANFTSPDQNKVVAINGKRTQAGLAMFDCNSMECRYQSLKYVLRNDYKGRVKSMAVSPDGQLIAIVTFENVVYLVKSSSLETIRKLSVSSRAVSACFTSDSKHILITDAGTFIYLFNVDSNRCLQKFDDSGNFSVESVVQCSPNNKYFAIGSHPGIVNVYNFDGSQPSLTCTTQPFKTFTNVLCPITFMRFNHSNEMLLFGSALDVNALKIAHCPSMTVYRNVPEKSYRIGNVKRHFKCADFSPNSGYMAAGNDRGQVLIYRLNHYKKY